MDWLIDCVLEGFTDSQYEDIAQKYGLNMGVIYVNPNSGEDGLFIKIWNIQEAPNGEVTVVVEDLNKIIYYIPLTRFKKEFKMTRRLF